MKYKHNDKAISNALELHKGDDIDIEFHMGSIKAEVKIINQKTNHGERSF